MLKNLSPPFKDVFFFCFIAPKMLELQCTNLCLCKNLSLRPLSHSSNEGRNICALPLNLSFKHNLGKLGLVCHKSKITNSKANPRQKKPILLCGAERSGNKEFASAHPLMLSLTAIYKLTSYTNELKMLTALSKQILSNMANNNIATFFFH